MSVGTYTIALLIMALSAFFEGPCPCRARSSDGDLLAFSLNLEYLAAEFFLHGARGYGLDVVAPNLTAGQPPIGARIANLDRFTRDIICQIGLEEVGHIRAIQKMARSFDRPLMDLSSQNFATWMNKAFGMSLMPPFNPYANTINFLLASYIIPFMGVTNYIGVIPRLRSSDYRTVVAGLSGVQSGQDAIIRTLLYERATMRVPPYRFTVAEFTDRISGLRNTLGNGGVKDEALVLSSRSRPGKVLVGDEDSLSYGRTPKEILRIMYVSGDETSPGGFFPQGARGHIARSHLT